MRNSKCQRGFMLLDFLVSLILVMGVSSLFFALSYSLSVVEIVQYFAFSVSRTYQAGHLTEQDQKALALSKYQSLTDKGWVKTLIGKNWFSLGPAEIGDFSQSSDFESSGDSSQAHDYVGARIGLTAKVLSFKIPFFGSTGEEKEFSTKISSFLGREPTVEECRLFYSKRWHQIKQLTVQLDGGGRALPYSMAEEASTAQQIPIFEDNGC